MGRHQPDAPEQAARHAPCRRPARLWVLRSGAPWRDLPETYGPRTTCYNRFVRWPRAGVWDRIMDTLTAGHHAAVQMIDISVVRVHQRGACIADSGHQDIGRAAFIKLASIRIWLRSNESTP
jgi:transposase